MENIAISEKVIPKKEKKQFAEEVKKIEFNVNAKEFVPVLSQDSPPNGNESWNAEQQNTKPVINKKIGENYNPVFMDGMTEKFIQGPYVGNGKDPEIPYVRYYSKSQAIDFFNKKYFTPDPSGEIIFRPGYGTELNQEDYQHQQPHQKPFLDSSYMQSNIFRPPIIDFLVQDILCRQYLTSRVCGAPSGGRRSGKQQTFVSYSRSGPKSAEAKKPDSAGEEWTDEIAVDAKEAASGPSDEEPPDTRAKTAENDNGVKEEAAKSELLEAEVQANSVESPKDQRPTRVRGKLALSKSPPSSPIFPEPAKTNSEKKVADVTSEYTCDKNSTNDHILIEDSTNKSPESQDSNGLKKDCVSLPEGSKPNPKENFTLEVNISIQQPEENYRKHEETAVPNGPVPELKTSNNNSK